MPDGVDGGRAAIPVRPFAPVLLALPGLALAGAGLLHPHRLTYDSSARWMWLHLAGLVVFPLVGWALAEVVTRRRDAVAWLVRLAAFGYATFYTALDVVYGIAAGFVINRTGPDAPRPPTINLLGDIADSLGAVGSWSLLAGALLVAADSLWRRRFHAIPVLLLLPGAWLVHTDHIFSPRGAAGMALIGLSTAYAARVAPR